MMEDLQFSKICVRLQHPLVFTPPAAGQRKTNFTSNWPNQGWRVPAAPIVLTFCSDLQLRPPSSTKTDGEDEEEFRELHPHCTHRGKAKRSEGSSNLVLGENPSFCSRGSSLESILRRRLLLSNEAQKWEGLMETAISRNGNKLVPPIL